MSDRVSVGGAGATRAGGSARAAAAIVALVLAAVVWLGASGRQPQPPPVAQSVGVSTSSPAAMHASTAAPTATPTSGHAPTATAVPPISPSPLVVPIPLGEDALAVIVHDSDRPRGYLGILHETSPGVLQASIRMAAEPTGSGPVTIQLAQLWTRGDGPPFAAMETFEIPLARLLAAPPERRSSTPPRAPARICVAPRAWSAAATTFACKWSDATSSCTWSRPSPWALENRGAE